MTVGELIKYLKPMNPELEIRLVELAEECGEDGEPEFYYPYLTDIVYDEKTCEKPVLLFM